MSSKSVSSSMGELSIPNVSKLLNDLELTHLRQLGNVLGLNDSKFSRMTDLPADLVAAWLRAEDRVLVVSGNPTWSTLKEALKKIGQNGIAGEILLTPATKMGLTREASDDLMEETSSNLQTSMGNLVWVVKKQLEQKVIDFERLTSIVGQLYNEDVEVPIPNFSSIDELFCFLKENKLLHFRRGFYKLRQIAREFGGNDEMITAQLEEHQHLLSSYNGVVRIGKFLTEQRRQNKPITVQKGIVRRKHYYAKLRANLGNPTEKALVYIDRFWKAVDGFGLEPKDAVFDSIYKSSVIVSWFIRSSKSSVVREYARGATAVFEQWNIEWVMINDEYIYKAKVKGPLPSSAPLDSDEEEPKVKVKGDTQLEVSDEPPHGQQSISDIVSQPIMKFSLLLQSQLLDLVSASKYNSLEAVELFLRKKDDVDPNMRDQSDIKHRWTPAMWAAKNGNLEIMKLLIEHGANVNMESRVNNWTPLIIASEEGHLEIVKLLLKNKANIDALTNEGLTAEMIAANRGHVEIVKILKERMKRSLGSSVDPEPLGSSVDPEPPKAGDETSRPEV